MKSLNSLFAAFAVLFFLGVPAIAQDIELFGLAEEGRENKTEAIKVRETGLYSIDPITGAATKIGPVTGYTECTGLDFEPVTNDPFAVCLRLEMDDEPGEEVKLVPKQDEAVLVKLDILTGEVTEVMPLNMIGEKSGRVTDISFRPDGVLFAHVNDVIGGEDEMAMAMPMVSTNYLGTIDTQTGQLSLIGPTGFGDDFSAIGFSQNGDNLYHGADDGIMGALNMLDQVTGIADLVTALNYPTPLADSMIIASLDTHPGTSDLYSTIAFENNSEIEVETRIGELEGVFLTIIDPVTGDVEIVGQTPDLLLAAIAFPNKKIVNTPIPTLSEWGLIAMAGALGIVGFMVIRRRKVTA